MTEIQSERNLQIAESAERTCGGFRSDVSDIGILAYKLGAKWADENPCFGQKLVLERNTDGTLKEDVKDILLNLPSDKACLARRKDDKQLYLLDPEVHALNDYVALEDSDFNQIYIINII